MRVTAFTCDRCGKTVEGSKHLHAVGVVVAAETPADHLAGNRLGYNRSDTQVVLKGEWCEDCLTETALRGRWVDGVKVEPEAPLTIEDVIRELVREEIAQG